MAPKPKAKPATASTVKRTRTQYTFKVKSYGRQLHEEGYSNSDIREMVFVKFDELTVKPPISTVSTWYNDHNMASHSSMAEGPETSQRKRRFISRKKEANPVAKLKPHCATCQCHTVVTTIIEAAATPTEDDSATTTEDDADTATEGDAATSKTIFRLRRVKVPRDYTEVKVEPQDISSESEGSIYEPNQEK